MIVIFYTVMTLMKEISHVRSSSYDNLPTVPENFPYLHEYIGAYLCSKCKSIGRNEKPLQLREKVTLGKEKGHPTLKLD